MRIINLVVSKYRQYRLKSRMLAARDINNKVPCDLILDVLDAFNPDGLKQYQIKDGYSWFIVCGYLNVGDLLNDLETVEKYLKEDDLSPLTIMLNRKKETPNMLVNFLVDKNGNIITLEKIEATLRTRITKIQSFILAIDSKEKHDYYLRKLTNILRETFVVTEALLKATDLPCQNPIKSLLKFWKAPRKM